MKKVAILALLFCSLCTTCYGEKYENKYYIYEITDEPIAKGSKEPICRCWRKGRHAGPHYYYYADSDKDFVYIKRTWMAPGDIDLHVSGGKKYLLNEDRQTVIYVYATDYQGEQDFQLLLTLDKYNRLHAKKYIEQPQKKSLLKRIFK